MNGKTELVTALVAGSNSGGQANSRTGYWKAVQSRLGILRGCLAGLAAVALVTFVAFRLHLNLSTSGSLYFLIVVMVSVIWGFWEASVTSLIAVGLPQLLLCPAGVHLDRFRPAELGGPGHLRNSRAHRQPALHARAGQGQSGSPAADGGPKALRTEPPYSAARSTPGDRAADGVPDSGDLPDRVRGLVRRHASAPGCDRFRGRRSRAARAQRLFPGPCVGRR